MAARSRPKRSLLRQAIVAAIVGACQAGLASTASSLRTLDAQLQKAPWIELDSGPRFSSYAKLPKDKVDSSVAVLRVSAATEASAASCHVIFSNPKTIKLWNPHAAQTTQLSGEYQLQTYPLPWPFAPREYLVSCKESKLPNGVRTHCTSSDDHPKAPKRSDRVRGSSETSWQFTNEPDGTTLITFEGLIDPRGSLPKWITNEMGKRASVNMVVALGELCTKEQGLFSR